MLNGVMYWPLCDFITFKFCPVYLQVCMIDTYHFISNLASLWLTFCSRQIIYLLHSFCLIVSFGYQLKSGFFLSAATCEQLVFVSMDNLHNLYGKPCDANRH